MFSHAIGSGNRIGKDLLAHQTERSLAGDLDATGNAAAGETAQDEVDFG